MVNYPVSRSSELEPSKSEPEVNSEFECDLNRNNFTPYTAVGTTLSDARSLIVIYLHC